MRLHRILLISAAFLVALSACGVPSNTANSTAPVKASPQPLPRTAAPTVFATPAAAGSADIVFMNARVLTMDAANPLAEAVAIQGNKIVAVGSNQQVLAMSGTRSAVIDLQGRTVTPGFIDSHTHRITQLYKWHFSTIEQAVAEALSQGWTSLVDTAVFPDNVEALKASGGMRIRFNGFLTANGFTGEPLGEWYNAYKPGQELAPNVRIAGLKIFIDSDSGRTLHFEPDALGQYLRERRAEGWQIAMKAIGQNSHALALTAIESVLQGQSNAVARFRLEHSLAASDDQLREMGQKGIIVGFQPGMPGVVWYMEDIHALVREQGEANTFRWPEYLQAGVVMAASAYTPDGVNDELIQASHVSPMGVLHRSVTQIGLADSQPEPWMLTRALTVEQLLPMLTINGAYSVMREDQLGSLTPGKLADMVVLSEDPRQVQAARLKDIAVLMTMVDGRVEYCAAGSDSYCPRSAANATLAAPSLAAPSLAAPSPGDITRLAAVTASISLSNEPAMNAVDGNPDTVWNSGAGPRQWLRFEFDPPRAITSVRLVVAQDPEGNTVHRLWAGTTEDNVEMLHEFAGRTADGQVLEFRPAAATAPIRILYIVTTDSTSWVAWREVQVFGQ
ncbi:MAG TPA: amidohydrolase family protein [Anaerolineales bacterium]